MITGFWKSMVSIWLTIILTLSAGGKGTPSKQAVPDDAQIMQLSEEHNVAQAELEKHYNELALKLLRESLNSEGNTMISPESIELALTMAAIGAKGETYDQLAELLCPGASKADLNEFGRRLIDSLNKDETVHVANSVWINKDCLSKWGVRVNEGYLNLLRKNFDANAKTIAFDSAALKEINGWISDETEGMIKDMLKEFSDDSFMLLINAMAFDGRWEEKYEKEQIDQRAVFTDNKGNKIVHKALNSTEDTYLQGCDATGVIKYYEGGRYAFMAMLPDDSRLSLKEYLSSLPDNAFTTFYNSRMSAEVITRIPCFSFDYEIGMKDVLKKLGVKRAFSKEKAEFFDMLEEGSYNPDETEVWIERVLHKTHIELDENGTKAAAATIVDIGMNCTSVGPMKEIYHVILNRPFIFAIMDTELGVPVFVGTVEEL